MHFILFYFILEGLVTSTRIRYYYFILFMLYLAAGSSGYMALNGRMISEEQTKGLGKMW
jgi:uncharacterized RDD family membrane protein YckC